MCTPRRRCERCSDSPVSQKRGFSCAAKFAMHGAPLVNPAAPAATQPSSGRFTHACICRRAGETLRCCGRRRRSRRRSRRPQQASLAAAPSSSAAPSPATPRRGQEAQNALLPRWCCCRGLLGTAAPAAPPPACQSAGRHGTQAPSYAACVVMAMPGYCSQNGRRRAICHARKRRATCPTAVALADTRTFGGRRVAIRVGQLRRLLGLHRRVTKAQGSA